MCPVATTVTIGSGVFAVGSPRKVFFFPTIQASRSSTTGLNDAA